MKNKVRALRKLKGLTQEQLAELIGVSRQTINAIEKEKFDPSLPTAFKMSQIFGLPIEEFFLYEESNEC
jgi:putative transcriptional regulator